jgi:hypothetical protein
MKMGDVDRDLEELVREARADAHEDLRGATRPTFAGAWDQLEALADEEVEDRDPELFAWIDAARSEARVDLEAASSRVMPGLPHVHAPSRAPRRLAWVIVLAAAAVILLFTGRFVLFATEKVTTSTANQASDELPLRDSVGEARQAPDSGDASVERKISSDISDFDGAAKQSGDTAELPMPPSAQEAGGRTASRKRKKKSRRDRLRDLDAEAQALWKAGNLAGAQSKFEAIVAKGGKSAAVEMAYGDLFTLARQRKMKKLEHRLWRDYLEVFPAGRHSDDASAGLCRRAPDSERAVCWEAYLKRFSDGAHRRPAEKALADEGSGAVQDSE